VLYMNRYDVAESMHRYRDHPILGPATVTLAGLVDWTDTHSDGWPYWSKPCRAARALQELIGNTRTFLDNPARDEVTIDDLKRAYRPVRSFATRHGADLTFYMPEAS
jgi:hypothetical protein